MSLMRNALLAASTNAWLREHAMRRQFVRRSVSRFMPGEHLDDAIRTAGRQRSDNYYRLACRILSEGSSRPGAVLHIATHDPLLINRLLAFIKERQIASSAYEFAMLYGIQRGQQQRLIDDGRRLRVLISYGEYWFPWYMRRLAERPANVGFVVRNLFG